MSLANSEELYGEFRALARLEKERRYAPLQNVVPLLASHRKQPGSYQDALLRHVIKSLPDVPKF